MNILSRFALICILALNAGAVIYAGIELMAIRDENIRTQQVADINYMLEKHGHKFWFTRTEMGTAIRIPRTVGK